MNNPYHIPITEIKNLQQQTNRDNKRNISFSTNITKNQSSNKIKSLEDQISQLRQALCQAIDQNQILRGRVAELQALLVVAQQEQQNTEKRYIDQKNKLLSFWKNNIFTNNKMELENANPTLQTSFSRSRSL